MIYPWKYYRWRYTVLPFAAVALFAYGVLAAAPYSMLYGLPALGIVIWNESNLRRMRTLLSQDQERLMRVTGHLNTGRSIRLTARGVVLLDHDGSPLEEIPWGVPSESR